MNRKKWIKAVTKIRDLKKDRNSWKKAYQEGLRSYDKQEQRINELEQKLGITNYERQPIFTELK